MFTFSQYTCSGKSFKEGLYLINLLKINSFNQITEPESEDTKLKVIADDPGFIRICSSDLEVKSTAKVLFWIVPSLVSFCSLNLLGYPLYSKSGTVITYIDMMDINMKNIKSYQYSNSAKVYVAFYWGYLLNDKILDKAIEYKALIKSIEAFNRDIVKDIPEINQNLVKRGSMATHFQDQLLQIEKYETGFTTESEFLNDQWTLKDKYVGITARFEIKNGNIAETIYELAYLRGEDMLFVSEILEDIQSVSGILTDNFRLKSDDKNFYPICTLTFRNNILKTINYAEYLRSEKNDSSELLEIENIRELDEVLYKYQQTKTNVSEDDHINIYNAGKLISTFEFGSAKKSFPSHTCYFYINKNKEILLSKKPV
jgi:hypothetical protein